MSMVPTLLSVENLSKSYGGVHAVRSVSFELQRRRNPGADRAQRRREKHLLRHAQRPEHAGQRPHQSARRGYGRPKAARDLAARRRAHVPDHRDVPDHDRARERAGRAGVVWPAIVQSLGLDRELRARGGRPAARSRRHGRLCRAALRRTRLWRSQAAGTRDRARQPAETAADGRADRRHGAARADRTDAAHRAHRPRKIDRRAVHRARHGRGVRTCRPHPRAEPRQPDRRRLARGSPRQPQVRAIYLGEGLVYDARHREGAGA